MATTNKFFKVKNGLDVNSNATVDSSGNVNLAGNLTANNGFVSADTFRLDTTYAGGSTQIGEFSWDPDNETARLLLDGVNLQIGQEHVIRVKNASGSVAIPDRTPVMFAGATGDTVTVSPAVSSNVAVYPSDYMVGITTEEIPADGFGFVTQFGFINQVNTTAWTVGTLLYVDPATAGGLTSTRPTAPAWQTPIAAVTKQNGSAGRILVRAIPGIAINHVEGVEINAPVENDILRINATGIVVNSNLSSANIANLAAATTTFTGNVATDGNLDVAQKLSVTYQSGDEGGEIFLNKAVTNTSITGGVTIDVYQNKLRFFEQGGSARGAYIDLTAAGAGVATNLLSGGTGGGADGNTTYTINAASATGGANIVLAGSDSSTDTITILGGNATTVTYANANAITINTVPVVASGTAPSSTDVLWVDTGNNASTTIPSSTLTAKGDIIVASANNTPNRLAVGTDGKIIVSNSSSATGVSWEYGKTLASSVPTGYYITATTGSGTANSTTYNVTAARAYYFPYIPLADMSLASVSIIVGSSAAGSTIRVGLYSSASTGIPGDLIADWGTVSGATTGTKTITGLSQNLSGGSLYWFALSAAGGSPVVTYTLPSNNAVSSFMTMLPASTITASASSVPTAYYETVTAGVLPATASSSLTTSTATRLFWLGVGV